MPSFRKWQELAIPIAILAGLFVILTPLPTVVVDFLLAGNMILAIIILSAALLAKSSTELTVFPAILLVSTLGRLVLNISTTRLILSNATTAEDLAAGGIIKSFGEYVIGNHVFVGVVIFAIVFIVQFVVVTKGSSRISEVAARFALDGMPGKQMAVDADLKSKIISPIQAKQQREVLQEKADFLGAMDGAGRFVRGDAIAGLIITLVNIIGGLAIGLLGGMEFSTAVDVYTKLTIGDGLASQLPAFLVAIAAGVLMARGSRESSVSHDMVTQLGKDPRVYFIAGVGTIALVFAGLPSLPLFFIGGLCLVLGVQSQGQIGEQQKRVREQRAIAEREATRARQSEEKFESLLRVDPIEIRLGVNVVKLADPKQGGALFSDVSQLRKTLFSEFGFVLPKVRISDDISLKENQFQVRIYGDVICEEDVIPDRLLAIDSGDVKAPIYGERYQSELGGCTWIEASQEHRAGFFRYQVLSPGGVIVEILKRRVLENFSVLFTRDCAGKLIEEVRKHSPLVVEELIPGKMPLASVQQVLKKLLEEKVSIRQLALILESLGDYSPHTNQIDELVEQVRQKLCRVICSRVSQQGALEFVSFEGSVEQRLVRQFRQSLAESSGVAEEFGENEFEWFCKEILKLSRPGREPVIVVEQEVRRWLRGCMKPWLAELNVLGSDEVRGDFELRKVGEVSLQPSVRKGVA